MKKFGFIAAALALTATPALAAPADDFTGFRIGATAGLDDVTGTVDTNRIVYGADAGYDFKVSDRIVLGAEVTATNVFEDSRTLGAAARAGVVVVDRLMPYVRAGWSNYRDVTGFNLNGLTVGGGLEYAVDSDIYVKAEYRYSDFEAGVGNHGALIGVGVRF